MTEGYDINWMAALIVAAVGLAAMGGLFAVSWLLAPKRPSAAKDMPYECGIPPAPFMWSQIQIRYYVFAILFLIFDVEAVFLFPWARSLSEDDTRVVFYEMLIFIAILFFGIIYGWRKGVLQWR